VYKGALKKLNRLYVRGVENLCLQSTKTNTGLTLLMKKREHTEATWLTLKFFVQTAICVLETNFQKEHATINLQGNRKPINSLLLIHLLHSFFARLLKRNCTPRQEIYPKVWRCNSDSEFPYHLSIRVPYRCLKQDQKRKYCTRSQIPLKVAPRKMDILAEVSSFC
jgi:hypothetical protein